MTGPEDDRYRAPDDGPPHPSFAGKSHPPWTRLSVPLERQTRDIPPDDRVTGNDPQSDLSVTREYQEEGQGEMMQVEW